MVRLDSVVVLPNGSAEVSGMSAGNRAWKVGRVVVEEGLDSFMVDAVLVGIYHQFAQGVRGVPLRDLVGGAFEMDTIAPGVMLTIQIRNVSRKPARLRSKWYAVDDTDDAADVGPYGSASARDSREGD
jgi:hypothetical protein